MDRVGKRRYNPLLIGLLIVLVVVIFFINRGSSDSVMFQIDAGKGVLGVARGDDAVIIPLSEIIDTEITDHLNFGVSVPQTQAGEERRWVYRSDELGEYLLYANEAVERYIIVHHKNGVVVYNSTSVSNTEKAYQGLLESMDAVT